MAYRLLVEKRVEKYLRRLEPKRYKQISNALHSLKDFPKVVSDIAPLRDAKEKHSFRLRKGSWRVLFTVYQQEQIIRIWKIDTRGDIY